SRACCSHGGAAGVVRPVVRRLGARRHRCLTDCYGLDHRDPAHGLRLHGDHASGRSRSAHRDRGPSLVLHAPTRPAASAQRRIAFVPGSASEARNTVRPANGKLGILTPGLGAVATTFMAGVESIRRGYTQPIGSLTQMATIRLGKRTENRAPLIKDFVPLA